MHIFYTFRAPLGKVISGILRLVRQRIFLTFIDLNEAHC